MNSNFLSTVDSCLLKNSEQELFWGIKLREALEIEPILTVGINYSIDYNIPIKAGISIGKQFSPDFSLYIGSAFTFYLRNHNVQDIGSVIPNYNSSSIFIGMNSRPCQRCNT